MHRWLLVLLIALLPLRGWVGDAMAGEMLARQLHHGVQHAVPGAHNVSSHDGAGGHLEHDCMDHAAASGQADGAAQSDDALCATCASCQACSAVALAFAVPGSRADVFAPPRPDSDAVAFASAVPAQRLKPPIS